MTELEYFGDCKRIASGTGFQLHRGYRLWMVVPSAAVLNCELPDARTMRPGDELYLMNYQATHSIRLNGSGQTASPGAYGNISPNDAALCVLRLNSDAAGEWDVKVFDLRN